MPRILSESEYNAIKDRVLASLPNGLTEAEFHRQIGPRMEQAIGEAENVAPTPEGSALGRGVSNFVGGLAQGVTGLWNAAPIPQAIGGSGVIEGPKQAIKAQLAAIEDQYAKVRQAASEGRYVEALGHAGGMIPLIGAPAAAAGEQIASGDVAGGMGSAAAVLAPAAVPLAREAVKSGLSQAARLAPGAAEALASAADRASTENMARAITPTVGPNKVRFGNMAAGAAPRLAREADLGAWSRQGLADRIGTKFGEAELGLDAAADQRLAGRAYPTDPILKGLETKRARLVAEPVEGSLPTSKRVVTIENGRPVARDVAQPLGDAVEPAPNAARIATLDKVISEVKQLGPLARYESLKRIRQAWDQVAKPKYSPSLTQDFLTKQGEASGAMDATGVIRDNLAKFDPETAKANEPYAFYRSVNDVLNAAEETDRTRPTVGRKIMARLVGTLGGEAAAGLPGAVVGGLLGPVVDSAASMAPTLRIQYSRGLANLADALRAGNEVQATSIIARLKALPVTRKMKAVSAGQALTMPVPATTIGGTPDTTPQATR